MDKTYLLNRSREEQARAEAATSAEARRAHEGLARCFREAAECEETPATIRRLQDRLASMVPPQQLEQQQ